MKKIIDGRSYDTETATKLAGKGTGRTDNFTDWSEELYVTKNGRFFIAYWGGAKTQYAEVFNGGRSSNKGSGMKTLSKSDALAWIDDSCFDANEEKLEEVFEIEEG